MIRSFLFAFAVVFAATILAACGGSQPPLAAEGARRPTAATAGYISLYSFGKRPSDGQQPRAGLIDVSGTLYGTTYAGGVYSDGTVFSVGTTGTEKVLYSFHGERDGANPSASLLNVKGALYGTTEYGGGDAGLGTVFKASASGVESVLHRFLGFYYHQQYYYDGAHPVASLLNVRGNLYGTTSDGGDEYICYEGCGSVFKIKCERQRESSA